jgi:hypothetical protein
MTKMETEGVHAIDTKGFKFNYSHREKSVIIYKGTPSVPINQVV